MEEGTWTHFLTCDISGPRVFSRFIKRLCSSEASMAFLFAFFSYDWPEASVKAHAIVPHNTDIPACLIFAFAFAILSSWAFSSFYMRRHRRHISSGWPLRRTASFLNHFFTSSLIASHSLSTNLENFTSTSLSTSKTLALVLNALPDLRFVYGRVTKGDVDAPGISLVGFTVAASFNALASFLCRVTMARAASL